jgi:hypothetical protein
VAFSDQKSSKKTDRNPKDYVLVSRNTFRASETGLDNTGERVYNDVPFPTLTCAPLAPTQSSDVCIRFPSDHGILRTTVQYVE